MLVKDCNLAVVTVITLMLDFILLSVFCVTVCMNVCAYYCVYMLMRLVMQQRTKSKQSKTKAQHMCSFIFEKTNFIMKGLGMRPLNVINPMRS